ncbi:MAG: hypothetical protein WB052_23125, partial [Pseudolabrys sp.]
DCGPINGSSVLGSPSRIGSWSLHGVDHRHASVIAMSWGSRLRASINDGIRVILERQEFMISLINFFMN